MEPGAVLANAQVVGHVGRIVNGTGRRLLTDFRVAVNDVTVVVHENAVKIRLVIDVLDQNRIMAGGRVVARFARGGGAYTRNFITLINVDFLFADAHFDPGDGLVGIGLPSVIPKLVTDAVFLRVLTDHAMLGRIDSRFVRGVSL